MTVHVIGAGLAGLAAALRLTEAGCRVVLHDKVHQAGGRCRSYFDPRLGRTLDCGIHIIFAGLYPHLYAYLGGIGATDGLIGPDHSDLDYMDTESGERWRLRPNAGRLPWWIVAAGRRIPGSPACRLHVTHPPRFRRPGGHRGRRHAAPWDWPSSVLGAGVHRRTQYCTRSCAGELALDRSAWPGYRPRCLPSTPRASRSVP